MDDIFSLFSFRCAKCNVHLYLNCISFQMFNIHIWLVVIILVNAALDMYKGP